RFRCRGLIVCFPSGCIPDSCRFFFFSSRRRHTRLVSDWSSDVCSSDLNAFQCLVETLMFYHPVAWWISRCVREERENCCDDLVIKVCGDRLAYARALATMEGLRGELPDLAFAASGGSLLNRIRRLFGGVE